MDAPQHEICHEAHEMHHIEHAFLLNENFISRKKNTESSARLQGTFIAFSLHTIMMTLLTAVSCD